MKHSRFISTAAVLFAAPDTASGKPAAKNDTKTETTGTTASASTATTATTAKPKITTEVIGVSTAVAMPDRSNKRGSKNKYPFANLEIGQSIAIKGAKAENLGSTLATANRNKDFAVFKRDDQNNVVRKAKEIKDANGVVTNTIPNAGEPVRLSQKVFFAVDCDPNTDPDKADVRIFRDHDKTFSE